MKLNTPRTIQQTINDERRKDIDNGVTLARRVDTLRDTLLNEEQKLENFRNSTIKIVQQEIDNKINEKTLLEIELVKLKEKRIELLKPLDEEWEQVNEEKQSVQKLGYLILKEKDELADFDNYLNERDKNLIQEEQRIVTLKEQVKQELQTAHDISLEAKNCLIEAKKEVKRLTTPLRKKEKGLKDYEEILRATVLSIEVREKQLKDDEKFIKEEKIRLADQRATMERQLARMKQ